MKKILQTIIFLITISSLSQGKLVGKYYSIPIGESDVTCIDFKKDNRFDYITSGCLGVTDIGSGIFKLKNKELKLYFDKKEQSFKSKVQIKKLLSKSKKQIKLEFNIKDEFNQPFLFIDLIRKSDKKEFSITSKSNIITLPKKNTTEEYQVYFIGYEPLVIKLDHNTDKVIDVVLFEAHAKVISEKIFTFNLIELNQKQFKVGKNTWDSFRKIKKDISK